MQNVALPQSCLRVAIPSIQARMNLDEIIASLELPDEARAAPDQLSVQLASSSHTLRTALLRRLHDGGRRPSALSAEERVRDCVREFEGAHGVPAAVTVCGSGPVPGPAGTDLLVRTVREALVNVAKHAGALRAAVTLERGPLRWWPRPSTVACCARRIPSEQATPPAIAGGLRIR